MSDSIRSEIARESAYKAWDTIRAKHAKRSEAAHKAWATRRKMAKQLAQKRSKSAKKAWVTRRATED
jgi:hypothetical protein